MRTKHSGKVDLNQPEIVKALRKAGCSVQSLASIGAGCPDLLVGKEPNMWLVEVKGPSGKLTVHQEKWLEQWRGVVHIVRTIDDALLLVGVMKVRDL